MSMARVLSRPTTVVALGLVAALAVVLALSCGIYDTSLLLPRPTPIDASTDGDVDAGDGCLRARWPSRPAADDPDAGADTPVIVDALRALDFGVSDAGVSQTAGFDLDGVCTCPLPDFPQSCRTLPGVKPRCDLADGRDNTASVLIDTFRHFSNAFSQDATNASLEGGEFGILIRIRNYNGTANDVSVEVAVFSSSGNDGAQDGGVPKRPQHDGRDRWTVDPASLVAGSAPPYLPVSVDANAYVSQGRFVATVDFPVSLGVATGSSIVELKGSVVVGSLVPDGQSFRIENGVLAGRWPTQRLLTSFEVLPDPVDPTRFLCGDSPGYAAVKELICSGQDIVGDLKQDNTNAPCDSISMALGFTATPALLGDVVRPPPRVKPCGPQWTDDCPR